MKKITNKIREIRLHKGMTQAALAEKLGINAGQVAKYENGDTKLNPHRIDQFAKALGVSQAAIIGLEHWQAAPTPERSYTREEAVEAAHIAIGYLRALKYVQKDVTKDILDRAFEAALDEIQKRNQAEEESRLSGGLKVL